MACCALAVWLLGQLVRPFTAMRRGETTNRWAPPTRWVPGIGASTSEPPHGSAARFSSDRSEL
jgi:hypothetical protein